MALINCPECGHTVSDKAIKCPKCGCLISTSATPSEFRNPVNIQSRPTPTSNYQPSRISSDPNSVKNHQKENNSVPTNLWMVFGFLGAIIVIIISIFVLSQFKRSNNIPNAITDSAAYYDSIKFDSAAVAAPSDSCNVVPATSTQDDYNNVNTDNSSTEDNNEYDASDADTAIAPAR